MIGAVVGLLTLLSALVLGLLIWTAYGVYAGQNLAVQTLAAKVLQLDLALADYGPEANPLRLQLRETASGRRSTRSGRPTSRDANFVANNFAAALRNCARARPLLAQLHPTNDAQTQALAAARAASDAIGQSRLQMSFALSAPICYPLVLHRRRLGVLPVPGLRAHVEGERDGGARRRRSGRPR